MVHIIRTIITVSAFLLATSLIVHAEDSEPFFLEPGIKPHGLELQDQHYHGVDMNISPQEYEAIYSRNRILMHKTLRSYSKDALKVMGIPEQMGYHVGAALDMAISDGVALNLNKSKTLAVEFKDASKSERALYFSIKLNW